MPNAAITQPVTAIENTPYWYPASAPPCQEYRLSNGNSPSCQDRKTS